MSKHLKKFVISIMLVLTVNFITPPDSQAMDFGGGILIKPLTSTIASVFDVINGTMTYFMFSIDRGVLEWANITVQDVINAMSEQSKWDGSLKSIISVTVSNLASALVAMEDFFCGNFKITNINVFKIDNISILDQIINKMTGGNEILADLYNPYENLPDGTPGKAEMLGTSIAEVLQATVASWYYALRNLAALGLLCALIFTAIRILISSVADEKAHYKMQLIDWAKATCLVIFVHLIMIFILNVCDILVDILKNFGTQYSTLAYVRGELAANFSIGQIIYLILYGMLTYYTLAFAFSYFKRFLYSMLLIVIAPIVSLLYAFGKSGKEIFNKWLKEFIYNAMLQPYHLLIYTLLFGWVISILKEGGNDLVVAVYTCIVAHFIRDAEKYYRSLFGMGKGVAGIGQIDTGEKVIKKMVETVKKVAEVVATVIPAGMALKAAKGAAMAGKAMNAQKAAGNMGQTAKGFKGLGGGNNTPTRAGNGPFDGEGSVSPRGADNPFGESDGFMPRGAEGTGQEPILGENTQPILGESQGNNQANDNMPEGTNKNFEAENKQTSIQASEQTEMPGDGNISDLGNVNQLNTNQLNADDAKLGNDENTKDKEIGIKDKKEIAIKDIKGLEARLEAGAIDKLVNAITGGSHTSVLPDQAPSTSTDKGLDLGLKNTLDKVENIDRVKESNSIGNGSGNEAKGEFKAEQDVGIEGDSVKINFDENQIGENYTIAKEIIEKSSDSRNIGSGISATVEQQANATENIDFNSQNNSSNTSNLQYKGQGDITRQLEDIIKRNGGNIGNVDEIANRVAKETGKSSEDIKKLLEGAYYGNGKQPNDIVIGETIKRTEIIDGGKIIDSGSKGGNTETSSESKSAQVKGNTPPVLLEGDNKNGK